MTTDRSCIGCDLWRFDPGWRGTRETPGDGWSASCNMKHWTLEGRNVRDTDWFTTMQKAKTCRDYKPRKGAPR